MAIVKMRDDVAQETSDLCPGPWKPQAQRGQLEKEEDDSMKEARKENSERPAESVTAQKPRRRSFQETGNGTKCLCKVR